MLRKTFVFFLAIAFLIPMTISGQDKLPALKLEEYHLKNGLRVILHQDKSTPIVAVNIWYHVGSKNEVAGRTGFAHLFEHMMFQGSKNYDSDYFTPLQEAGANINGSTTADRTNYYEVVPSNFLELALFMEADRMGGLLEAMTQEKLNNQRDVVKNERRQNYDNRPYGTVGEKIAAIIYPKEHPYSWTTIGSLDDLTKASQDDVKGFFREYYVPNNASLVIAGDFDSAKAKVWVEKYFGSIKQGKEIKRPTPPQPKINGEIRQTVEDNVPLPARYMVWMSVPQGNKDEAALDMLGSVLSSGRGSRLQANLVYGKQLVQNVNANNGTREIAGQFQISATARPNKSLDDIEKEINLEIERLKKEPPTADELNRALNQTESQSVFGLQTVLGKANSLNSNATFFGTPNLLQAQLDEYRKVTPADVQRVANQYLNGNRLVMSFVPQKGQVQSKANTEENQPTSTSAKGKTEPDASKLPKPGANPKFSLPPIEKTKLSNGLEVWMVHQTELPIVSMNLVFKSGATFEPDGKTGVGQMTASLLNTGTKTRSAVEINQQLQSIGANVFANSGWDSTGVSIQTLTKNIDKALELYSDVITNPIFPTTEIDNYKRRTTVSFLQAKSNPTAISDNVYNKLVYGNHPYGKDLTGDEKTVKSITQEDLAKYYESTYRPNNGVLIVVGDVTKATLLPKLEKAFANWKAGNVATATIPSATMASKPGIYLVDKPGAAQSVVAIGQVGVSRDNPDYYALQVMNTMLGGQFTSRINLNLREDKGYTYGARSAFSYRKGAGPFTASGNVQTAVTKESVVEFMKELNGIRGVIPVTPKELEYSKQSLIRRYPSAFETVGQISGQLSSLVVYGLSDTSFNEYIPKINAVTVADVNRVANKYLDPSKMAIVIVGDRKIVETGLKQLGYSFTLLDTEGKPLAE